MWAASQKNFVRPGKHSRETSSLELSYFRLLFVCVDEQFFGF